MDEANAEQRHRTLTAQGWERRFTGDKSRVLLSKKEYEALGMETHIEDGILGSDQGCTSCFEAEGFRPGYVTLYTRGQAKETGRFDDDLFD
jgi:hypothetical protein